MVRLRVSVGLVSRFASCRAATGFHSGVVLCVPVVRSMAYLVDVARPRARVVGGGVGVVVARREVRIGHRDRGAGAAFRAHVVDDVHHAAARLLGRAGGEHRSAAVDGGVPQLVDVDRTTLGSGRIAQ